MASLMHLKAEHSAGNKQGMQETEVGRQGRRKEVNSCFPLRCDPRFTLHGAAPDGCSWTAAAVVAAAAGGAAPLVRTAPVAAAASSGAVASSRGRRGSSAASSCSTCNRGREGQGAVAAAAGRIAKVWLLPSTQGHTGKQREASSRAPAGGGASRRNGGGWPAATSRPPLSAPLLPSLARRPCPPARGLHLPLLLAMSPPFPPHPTQLLSLFSSLQRLPPACGSCQPRPVSSAPTQRCGRAAACPPAAAAPPERWPPAALPAAACRGTPLAGTSGSEMEERHSSRGGGM